MLDWCARRGSGVEMAIRLIKSTFAVVQIARLALRRADNE
jgi:hypothetical protein